MGSAASSPPWGARMKPLLNTGTATSALKWSIVCGLHKLLMFFIRLFVCFTAISYQKDFHFYYYYFQICFLLLSAFAQFLHSGISLCILPYSCSLFFERFALCEEFSSSQTWFIKARRNKQPTRRIKGFHKLLSNIWANWRGVFVGSSFFFSSS